METRDKVEIGEGWNTTRYRYTYDPLGEVFVFAAGPFFKHPVFLAPAFAFGCGLLDLSRVWKRVFEIID